MKKTYHFSDYFYRKMQHSDLMECGDYFALCKNCGIITVFEFSKCHGCRTFIDKKSYRQHSDMKKYNLLVKALMSFTIDVLEDCHRVVYSHRFQY